MAKKLTYVGPPGMAVAGFGPLDPGQELEVEDDATYEQLKDHSWFESARSAAAKRTAKSRETDEEGAADEQA